MLDEILKLAMDMLGVSSAEVRKAREALLEELTQDEARYAARTALRHPEGSTTPLNETADRSQQTYTKTRAAAVKALPQILATILAEQVAREKRDEAAAARDRHLAEEQARRAVGPHPETRELFARLFKHGVTPWHLKAMRDEDVAILADLIRWKANDARYKDPASPWRSVLSVYANRLILEPEPGVKVRRSSVGTPVRGKRHSSPKYYMFNEVVQPGWADANPAVAAVDSNGGSSNADSPPAGSSVDELTLAAIDSGPVEGEDGAAAAISSPPALGVITADSAGEAASTMGVEKYLARPMAEALCAGDGPGMAKFWPSGIRRGEYDPAVLIPALERTVNSPERTDELLAFLRSVKAGDARGFIDRRRERTIRFLAIDLEDGVPDALRMARENGLLP